jgi:hypothetical protein
MADKGNNILIEPDPVIEAYKKDVDRTLLRESLKLTVEQRFEQFESFMQYFYELREAGQRYRQSAPVRVSHA